MQEQTFADEPLSARRLLPGRLAARGLWLLLVPAVASWAIVRYLVPGRSEVGPGFWGWLARIGDQYPAPLGIGAFVLVGALVRHFADVLPWGRHLRAASAEREAGAFRAAVWLVTLLCAIAAALVLRATVGQPYRVSSGSMLPNLEPTDDLLVSKLAFGVRLPGLSAPVRSRMPRRGDLVVFRGRAVGETAEEMVVKRVIGLPGDKIATSGGFVAINGWPVPVCDAGRYVHFGPNEPVIGRLEVEFLEDKVFVTLHTPEAVRFDGPPVKPGEVFVLGDNRNDSTDSRTFNRGRGAGVPLSAIEGKVWRLVGWDSDGHLDMGRLLRAPSLDVHLPGMDGKAVRERIARCLKSRPAETWPPPPSLMSDAPAR